jgi:hypothetical protein
MRRPASIVASFALIAGASLGSVAAPPASAAPGFPDAWLLESPQRQYLSGAAETRLLWKSGAVAPNRWVAGARGSDAPSTGTDVRINQPGEGEFLPNCNTQNEVHIARFGNNVVAGWNDGGQCDYLVRSTGISLSGFGWSDDGGKTWHDGGTIAGAPGGGSWGDPVVAADTDGSFYYAELADDPSGRSIIGVAKSTDGGRTWSAPVDASPGRPAANSQDKEWIAVDNTGSPHRNNVYLAWIEFRPNGNEIMFSRSIDRGESYESPIQLTKAASQRGTGTQVAVGPDGEVYVLWVAHGSSGQLPTSVWFTKSLDGGVTFDIPRSVATINRIGHSGNCQGIGTRDVLNGDIRVRPWPSMAADVSGSSDPLDPDYNPNRGQIYVAFPSRGTGTDEADVHFIMSSDRGASWTTPTKINDDTTTNDQFHPQVAVDPSGAVGVSWYDRRLSGPVPPNWGIDLFAAVSEDGGATFSPNFRVSDVTFPPSRTNPNTNVLAFCYMGEYNGMVSGAENEFLVNWGDNRDGTPAVPDPNVYFDRIDMTAP